MDIFFSPNYSGAPFELFGRIHQITLFLFLIVNVLLIFCLKKLNNSKLNTCFRIGFALYIALFDLASILWFIYADNWSSSYSLPLHLCDMAVIISVIVLISRNHFLYEVLYFWGLAGTLQAIITPDLTPYNFPHFVFFYYFILHCSIITAILYMTFIERYRPTLKSIWRTFLATNVYAAVVAVINLMVKGNYMFLCSKPADPTILDYLGPWPWYILVLEPLSVILYFFFYSPFAIKDITSKRDLQEAG